MMFLWKLPGMISPYLPRIAFSERKKKKLCSPFGCIMNFRFRMCSERIHKYSIEALVQRERITSVTWGEGFYRFANMSVDDIIDFIRTCFLLRNTMYTMASNDSICQVRHLVSTSLLKTNPFTFRFCETQQIQQYQWWCQTFLNQSFSICFLKKCLLHSLS